MVKKFFMIHDNGGRPFNVVVTKTKIDVFIHKPYDNNDINYDKDDKDDINQYNILIKSISPYREVFIGKFLSVRIQQIKNFREIVFWFKLKIINIFLSVGIFTIFQLMIE
jgi:hypothetical protein